MSIEDKLDKISFTLQDISKTNKESFFVLRGILEKLTEKEVTIKSPISANGGHNDDPEVGKKINKHLYDLANKIERRKVVDKPKMNNSLDIYLGLMDDKGNVISKQSLYKQEDKNKELNDGQPKISVNQERKKVYKIRVFGGYKAFVGWLNSDGGVILKVPKERLPQLRNDSCADRPGTYKAEWYIEKDNELVEYIPKVFINEITVERKEPQASPSYYVTGYITDDGRAIYYDQYL